MALSEKTLEGAAVSGFLEEYLEWGLSEIAVADHEFHETASGHKEETHETVVARKGKKFVRTTVHQYIVFLGNSGCETNFDEKEIAESEYRRVVKGKEIVDSPEAIEEVRQRKERAQRQDEIYARLLRTAPGCPKCRKTMTLRTGKFGEFWGCSDFPRCKGTSKLSPEAQSLYRKWGG